MKKKSKRVRKPRLKGWYVNGPIYQEAVCGKFGFCIRGIGHMRKVGKFLLRAACYLEQETRK